MVVNYKAEAFLFDELLIETHIGEVAPKGFRMFHRIGKDMKLIALVENGLRSLQLCNEADRSHSDFIPEMPGGSIVRKFLRDSGNLSIATKHTEIKERFVSRHPLNGVRRN